MSSKDINLLKEINALNKIHVKSINNNLNLFINKNNNDYNSIIDDITTQLLFINRENTSKCISSLENIYINVLNCIKILEK